MCIRDRPYTGEEAVRATIDLAYDEEAGEVRINRMDVSAAGAAPVSYTHLRAHETVLDLVCRLLHEKKKKN